MKSTIIKQCILAFLVSILLLPGSMIMAQADDQKVYVEVACIKAKNEQLYDFVMDKGKKFQQEVMNQGMILNWIAMQVMYPNGEDCDCDIRMVSVFDSMDKLDKMWEPDFGAQVAGKVFGENAMATWEEWKSLARDKGSAVYELKMAAAPGSTNSPMSSVRWLNVPAENMMEFERMEKEVWMPVVKEAMKSGIINDYHIWGRIMPGGTDMEGNYVTVADFNSFAHMGETDWEEFGKIFSKVHPGVDMMEMAMKSQGLVDSYSEETVKVMTSLTDQ